MSPAIVSLVFNAMLAVLLVVTIIFCYRLTIKIRQLQDGRGELAAMIAHFDKSTERANLSLAELQNVSKKITDALQLKIDKANFLADDLAFLIEKSTKLANQLEQLQKQRAEQAKSYTASTASSTQMSEPTPSKQPPVKSGIEQLLASSGQSHTPSVASIEAMLQKLANTQPPKRSATQDSETHPRTDAERELLNALKSGRG